MGWLSPAVAPRPFREGLLFPGDPDLYDTSQPVQAYRSLTQDKTRDLPAYDHERMIRIAAYLARQNPLGWRLSELFVDYLAGEGFTYAVKSDEVRQVLDRFWNDATNDWPLKQFQKVWQLSVFGDQTYPAFVDQRTGEVKLGYIDPLNIKGVAHDPRNAEVLTTVYQKSIGGIEPPPLTIIHVDQRHGSSTEGLWIGGDRTGDGALGTVWWTINNFSNAARGISDLTASMDWLDLYDQFLFGEARKAADMGNYIWDVTLEDYGPEQIRAWLMENPPPTGPVMRAHNQKIKWEVVDRKFQAHDVSEQARTIRMQAAIPHGWPEGWLFNGSETNRSTLGEQAMPILKYLSRRQAQMKARIRRVLEFVRDQAIIAKKLPRTEDEDAYQISVEASEVSTVDLAKTALTLKDVTAAMVVAEDRQYVTHEEAAGTVRRIANEFGTDLPPEIPAEEAVKQGVPELAIQGMAQAAEIAQTARAARTLQRPVAPGTNGRGR